MKSSSLADVISDGNGEGMRDKDGREGTDTLSSKKSSTSNRGSGGGEHGNSGGSSGVISSLVLSGKFSSGFSDFPGTITCKGLNIMVDSSVVSNF